MKSRALLTGIGACLLLTGGVLFYSMSGPSAPPVAEQASPQSRTKPGIGERARPAEAEDLRPVEDTRADASKDKIFAEIEEASVTYDAAALPLIGRYLLHSDPEVRASALNGMLILGEAGAAPLLRDAAGKLSDPREAAKLLDAADYLELPPGTFVPKERTEPGTRVPGTASPGGRPRATLPPERRKPGPADPDAAIEDGE